MTRSILTMVCISSLLLLFTGCALFEYLDGSPPEKIKRIRMSKDEVWNRMEALEADKAALEKQNRTVSDTYRTRVKGLEASNEVLKQKIDELERDKDALAAQKRMLEAARTIPMKVSYAGMQTIKIKVLSGTGKLISAVDCAKRLKQRGYRVDRVDLAPRTGVSRDIVFFASGSQDEGRRLSAILGGNTVVKPLSWHSIFDIIIVTGVK